MTTANTPAATRPPIGRTLAGRRIDQHAPDGTPLHFRPTGGRRAEQVAFAWLADVWHQVGPPWPYNDGPQNGGRALDFIAADIAAHREQLARLQPDPDDTPAEALAEYYRGQLCTLNERRARIVASRDGAHYVTVWQIDDQLEGDWAAYYAARIMQRGGRFEIS